jgi:hypothetical protein
MDMGRKKKAHLQAHPIQIHRPPSRHFRQPVRAAHVAQAAASDGWHPSRAVSTLETLQRNLTSCEKDDWKDHVVYRMVDYNKDSGRVMT